MPGLRSPEILESVEGRLEPEVSDEGLELAEGPMYQFGMMTVQGGCQRKSQV